MTQEPRQTYETTKPTAALFGFYASCTGVGLGATVAASALIVFGDGEHSATVATVAIVVTAICSVLTWWTLAKARGDR